MLFGYCWISTSGLWRVSTRLTVCMAGKTRRDGAAGNDGAAEFGCGFGGLTPALRFCMAGETRRGGAAGNDGAAEFGCGLWRVSTRLTVWYGG